jgi:flagellar protein FliS
MAYNTFDRYLEAEVLNADPVKLIQMLYRGALEAIAAARRHLAEGAVAERSRQILRAWEILNELRRSLNRTQGGEIGLRLAELYGYMQQRLMDANAQQSDAALAEVETLLGTLHEAWREVRAPARAAVEEYSPVSAAY